MLAHPTRENGFVLAVFFRFSYVNGGAFCRCQSCVPAVSSLCHDRVLAMLFCCRGCFFLLVRSAFLDIGAPPRSDSHSMPGGGTGVVTPRRVSPHSRLLRVFGQLHTSVSPRMFGNRPLALAKPPLLPAASIPPLSNRTPTNPGGATNPCTVSPPPGERPLLGAGVVPPGRPRLLPVFARRDPRGVHRGLPPAAVSRRGVLVAGRHADVRRRSPVPGLEVPAVSVPGRGVGAGAIRGGRGVRAPR